MLHIIILPQDSAKRSEGCRGAQKAVARTFGVVITVLALWLICASSAQAWGISLDTLSALMEQDTLNRMMAEQERLRNIDADTPPCPGRFQKSRRWPLAIGRRVMARCADTSARKEVSHFSRANMAWGTTTVNVNGISSDSPWISIIRSLHCGTCR